MPLSFDHLPSLGQQKQSSQASSKKKTGGLSFDSLPSINYAKSDDDIRFKIARGMSSQLFASPEGNARILAEAKQKLTHPVRLLRAESKKIASELPNDFNYKALDPLGILDGQQSLSRFSAAKENKPLKGFAYKDEAENIYNQFDDQNISAAVSKLKSVFPEAGFDKQRPSQVLADARQRFYPELDPTTFMRQMGANPRSKDNPAYVDAEPKELSLGSAMWNAVKTGATKPFAGAVRAYADYTGDENLAKEAQSVTEGTQEDMTDSMRGRSGAGKVAVGIANSAPLMALTYATGGLASGVAGVGLGTAAMASGVGIDKYGSNRAEGFSVADSAKNAAVTGIAEGAFEALPLGSFLKTAGKGVSGALKKVGTQAGTEATSEALTSVAQDVADYKMLGKELTGDSLLNNAIDSAIVGGVMGAGFGSVAALRDSVKRKTNTGDIDVDSGAEVAKTAVQQKLLESVEQQAAQSVIKSKLADIAKPELEANKIAAPAPQNAMDDLLLGQAQADFDRVAKRELDLLRESVGNASVGLDASQVNSIANGIAEKWGVDASSILGEAMPSSDATATKPSAPASQQSGFSGVASSLGTSPQQMLADSRVNADVVAQPESEADDVSIGESAIHGNGLIANRNLDSRSGVTLALGANRTEAGQVVNHSDTPNTNVAIVDGVSTAVPVAPIERGEELTINYQKDIPRIRAAANAQTAQPSNLINQQQDQRIDFGGRTNDVAELSAQISNIRNAAKNRMLKTSEKNKIAELTGAINAINQEVTNDAGQYGPGNREPSNSIEVEKNVVPGMDQSLRQSNSFEAGEQQATQQLGVEQGSQGQAFAVPPVTNNVAVDDPISFLQSENEKLRADAEKYRAEARSNDITRLPNRRQFDDDFLARPSRAVAAIDMDGLKALNDSVGHKAADAVLAKLGEHLRSAESRGGRAYHLSGDEFAVSFDDPDSAQQVMAELQEQLDNVEVTIDTPSGQYVYRGIGVSFGVGENYAKADESAKSDKQRRLESGKREDARASGGQSLPTPRRLIPVAQGSDINNLQWRDVQNTDDGQAGQVEQQQAPQTQQVSVPTTGQSNRVRMTRDQVRSDIANNLGKNVASKLERQPWFNVVDSVDQLPESAIKSIDDAQNVQGFVLPDGSVYIVAGNIDQNATGVVLHEVGVHYGMRGVLGKDFAQVLERFKSLRQANKKVQAAYDSVPGDTQDTNLDEEALAYYVEDNWGSKAPLMQRITDAIKAFANRLGIPLSKLNASPELLVQIAKGATKKAASGRVRFNGGDTMRSTRNSYPASLPIQTITKPEMLRRGADGNVNTAKERYIPLNKIDGLEPTPAASDEEGYRKGREITQPIEVVYSKSDDTYYLYSGNHRVTQAKINGDSHIRAFVQPDRGDVGPSATAILSETNLGVARSPDEMSEFILLDGVLRSTTNSNGQSIAETEEGVRNFWEWFGDSKVVDADGRPMVVYHGTRSDVSVFDENAPTANQWLLGDDKNGFFFTTNPGRRSDSGPWSGASGYAGTRQVDGETKAPSGANVMSVYLALGLPYKMSAQNYRESGVRPDLKEGLETLGYDGIQIDDGTLVAFSPSQIKSATGNSGDFSSSNPDIRYSKRRQDTAVERAGDTIDVDGVQRPTTNSSGNPIAQDDESIRNFWRWFGDSKVVDQQGRPLVVYHGTDNDFYAFDKAKVGSNFGLDKTGFFFSNDADTANISRKSYPKKSKFSFSEEDKVAAKAGRIVEAYVKIERPLYASGVPGWENSMGTSAVNLYDLNRDAIETTLPSGEYDGFMLKAEGRYLIVPIEPTQIKSATGNSGEFSSENPDIRYSRRRDYGISHRPMTKDGGAATLDDLVPAFGDDIYGKDALQFFGSGDTRERKVLQILKSLRGKPDAKVTIYRGVPAEADSINSGDWVTLSKEAAQDYAYLLDDGKVISLVVPASQVTSWADSLLEFGYFPDQDIASGGDPNILKSKRRTPVNEIVAQDNSDNRGGLVGILDSAKKLIEAPYKSATDKLRRSKVGRPLADAIDKFYDNRSRRVGEMDSILRPVTKEATKGDLESFKTLMAHLQNARVKEFRQGFSETTKNVKDMFSAWQKVADTAGEENQSIGVKVFDEKINQWRPIGRVKGIFWPRAVKKKYQLAMMNPEKYAKEWAEMVDILKGSGRISSIEEAEKYLNTQFRNESSDDYFAGIEKARTDPMPEELYDYSWEQAIKYKDSWAERISQIEAFGQKGPSGEDLFDKTLNSTLNKTTRDHVARIRDGIFRVNSNRIINQWLQTFSSVLTGLQLGNPASSIVNLVGGLTLTAQSYPARYWVKGLLDLYKLGDAVNQAYNTGVLADDYLGVAADNQYDGVPDWVSKGTSALLNYGGFTPAERFVRSHNMLVAKSFLRDSIKAWNKNITSRKSKLAIAWLQRNGGFDYRTLLIENGAGKETDRFIRKAVNETQGSYKLDQIPMFTDEPLGKFLLKYQKFGFQVIRMFTKNHLEPFMASLSRGEKVTYEINGKVVEDRVRNFIPLLRYFVAAIPGGLITEYLRSALFGYLSSGPDDEEIKKALADTENAKAMGLLIERGVSSVVSMGALGFVGNYGQSLLAWQDRQRYKNPLNPPGISVINSIAGLLQKGLDQGQLTWRDAHEFTQQQWSLYRTSAKLTESGFELFAPDSSLGKSTQADRDRKWVRKMARRYADEAGIEAKTRAPEEPVFTENTPMNTNIKLALLVGDAERAKQIAIEAMKGKKTAKEIDSLKLSIAGSIRAYRPALVSQSSSMVESKRFMLWAKKNLTAERYARLERIDSAYMDAAKRSGIWNWKDVKVDSDMGKLRVLSPAEIDAYIRRKMH